MSNLLKSEIIFRSVTLNYYDHFCSNMNTRKSSQWLIWVEKHEINSQQQHTIMWPIT